MPFLLNLRESAFYIEIKKKAIQECLLLHKRSFDA